MKRYQIWGIAILMGLSLALLVSFQLYWINNVITINSERFKADVFESLQSVALKAEKLYIAEKTLTTFAFINADSNAYFINKSAIMKKDSLLAEGITVPFTTRNLQVDTLPRKRVMLRFNGGSEAGAQWADSIGNVIKEIPPDSIFSIDVNKNKKEKVISLVVSNIEQLQQPFNLPPNVIDSLLLQELSSRGITANYTFAVWNTVSDTVLYSNDKTADFQFDKSMYKASLSPNNIFGNFDFLLVNFPSQDTFLLKKIWTTLLSSAVLILIILFCFVYALHIIFRQKKLSEIKNDFINNMTHEFKTPVATIALASEALTEPMVLQNTEAVNRYVGMIRSENERLGSQVEKVLQAATLERNEFTLHKKHVNFGDIIREVCEKFKFQIEEMNGQLEEVIDNTVTLKGDEFHLHNAVRNLLDNAVKYSNEAPRIKVILRRSEKWAILEVTDKGIGMTAYHQRHIFERFYRVPTGNLHDVKGFGLGLHYVLVIAQRHAGSIHVHSEPGRGSTFQLSFPLSHD